MKKAKKCEYEEPGKLAERSKLLYIWREHSRKRLMTVNAFTSSHDPVSSHKYEIVRNFVDFGISIVTPNNICLIIQWAEEAIKNQQIKRKHFKSVYQDADRTINRALTFGI